MGLSSVPPAAATAAKKNARRSNSRCVCSGGKNTQRFRPQRLADQEYVFITSQWRGVLRGCDVAETAE